MYQATGSVLQMNDSHVIDKCVDQMDDETAAQFKLRFFTPREVANLMCFPETFSFPPDVSTRQMYKLLGNSVNVKVVSWVLLNLLLKSSESHVNGNC